MDYIITVSIFLLNWFFFNTKINLNILNHLNSFNLVIKRSLLTSVFGLIIPYTITFLVFKMLHLNDYILSSLSHVGMLLLFSFTLFNYKSFAMTN